MLKWNSSQIQNVTILSSLYHSFYIIYSTGNPKLHNIDHNDVIKWKYFPRYWPFVRGIHWRPVNSPHKGKWCGALMFSLICVWITDWVNNREAGELRRHRNHYDVTVMRCMRAMSSQIIENSTVWSTNCSGQTTKAHQTHQTPHY